MRLTPKAIRAIERGAKTTHRVLVKDPEARTRKNGTTYLTQPFRPTVGQALPVAPADGDRAPVRVEVTEVRREMLGDITPDQVGAEGHGSLSAFADEWMRVHSGSWPPQTEALCKNCDGHTEFIDHEGQKVPCEECDLGVIEVDDTPDPEATLSRFERKHGHHLVWVVTFDLLTDIPRFLNKRAYLPPTTSMSEALEPVEILGPPHPDWKQRAERRRIAALKDRDGARLAGLDRLTADLEAEALRVALESDADVSKDLFVIRDRVEKLKRRVEGKSNQHRRAA